MTTKSADSPVKKTKVLFSPEWGHPSRPTFYLDPSVKWKGHPSSCRQTAKNNSAALAD